MVFSQATLVKDLLVRSAGIAILLLAPPMHFYFYFRGRLVLILFIEFPVLPLF
tara:strand:- start:389 stop:547 length:159 start_codon:yes stop_codon:yes gene_type:complete